MFVRGNSHCFWAIAVCVTLALQALAQPPEALKPGALVGEEKRTRDELDAAGRLAADKRWDDAIKRYQQILAESGDLLVTAPGDANRAIPARWLVHQRIAALPEEARKIFRNAVEAPAKKWLEEGAAHRDSRLLEQVVAEAFCSQSAGQALHLLGDLAFERGEFEVAEHYWRMLARYPSEANAKLDPRDDFELHYPDDGDGALAQAKLILSLLFRGEKDRAQTEIEAFAKLHPTSEGYFAGKQGMLTERLKTLLASDAKWSPRGNQSLNGSWSTFAGDPSRNFALASMRTPYWRDEPSWWRKLPGDPKAKPHKDADPPLGTGAAARSLAFAPAIVPGYVLVADAARVFAYHLEDGRPAAKFDYRLIAGVPESLDLRVPSRTDARYTLTIVGDTIYARFGAQPVRAAADPSKPQEIDSAIVCLAMERNGKDLKLRFRWQIRARTLDTDPPAMFEGAPLVHGGRLYVARTQFDGRQAISSIQCYDADGPDGREEPPRLRWKQDLWSVEPPTEPVRHRHDLLTLAGPNVVNCTHSGAVIALDAISGKRAWAYRYKPAPGRPQDGVQPHDLCPCIAANGRIFAAPADSDRILCLDARTGASVWQCEGLRVVQMLGVSNGSLFVTLGGYPQGIRAYRVSDGRVIWTKPDDGDQAAFGRGLITDQWIFWPTRQGLRVLRQDNGELIHAGSNQEPWGNLVFGEGCLIVATPTEIWGFVPDRLRVGQLRLDAGRDAKNAEAHYRLALAEADAGNWNQAIAEFQKVEELADGAWLQGNALSELARHRRNEILILQAEDAWKHDRKDAAKALLSQAAGEPFSLADRVRAWAFRLQAGDRAFPDLFEHPRLASLWLTQANGQLIRADAYLHGLLDDALRKEWANRAEAVLAKNAADAIRRFPQAPAVQAELRRRARQAQDDNKPWDAAENLRLLHGSGLSDLAAIYDREGYREAAQALRHRLNPGKYALAEEPLKSHAPELQFPLKPAATFELSSPREWPLGPFRDEMSPLSDGRAFFFDAGRIICRSLSDGKSLWSQAIEHDARWCAFHAESVIVAGPNGVSRLRRGDGRVAWQFLLPDGAPLPSKFPDSTFRTFRPQPDPQRLSSFSVAGSRLFCRWGEQRLLALDLETGAVLWQLAAPGAPIRSPEDGGGLSPHFLASADVMLVQTTGGECLGVQSGTGRILYRQPTSVDWAGSPVAIDSKRAVFVADADRIKTIELDSGREIWSQLLEGADSLSGGAPQLRRDGSQLLAVVERNYGCELERWDLEDGKPALRRIFLGTDRIDLAASAFVADAFVLVGERAAVAFDRESGKRLWEFPLPRRENERWLARPAGTSLLIFPEFALPRVNLDWLGQRAADELAGIPSLARFQTATNMLYHGYFRRAFPLLAIDPKAGKKVQELNFPVSGPKNPLLLGERAAVISEGKLIRFD